MVDFVHCCAFMYYRQGELMHLKWQKKFPPKNLWYRKNVNSIQCKCLNSAFKAAFQMLKLQTFIFLKAFYCVFILNLIAEIAVIQKVACKTVKVVCSKVHTYIYTPVGASHD